MLKRSNIIFKEFYSILNYYKFGLDVGTQLISIDNDKHSTNKRSFIIYKIPNISEYLIQNDEHSHSI